MLPTSASLNMAKFAQCNNSIKNFCTLLKSLSGNLLIIPYQLTKFQTPSSNMTRLKSPLQRAVTREKWDRICSKVSENLLIITNQLSSHCFASQSLLSDKLWATSLDFSQPFLNQLDFSLNHTQRISHEWSFRMFCKCYVTCGQMFMTWWYPLNKSHIIWQM